MDPVVVAWASCARPQPDGVGATGRCARCLNVAALVPVGDVVSNKFTGATEWLDPRGSGLCPACTWGYRTPELRRQVLLVDLASGDLSRITHEQLYALLSAPEPLGAHLAVSLPLAGRKHVLPAAQWGRVCADGTTIPWSAQDAGRLARLAALRSAGVAAARLAEDAPPWSAVRSATPAGRVEILEHWQALEPWRRRRLWLDVAIAVTHPNRPRGGAS